MNMIEALWETATLAEERGMPHGDPENPLSLNHIYDMIATIERSEKPFSEGKLGRWLGWAQAAVVASGVATLVDMKAINREHADSHKPDVTATVSPLHAAMIAAPVGARVVHQGQDTSQGYVKREDGLWYWGDYEDSAGWPYTDFPADMYYLEA